MNVDNLTQKPAQAFFVLVKPDGMANLRKITQMFFTAFSERDEKVKIGYFNTIFPSETLGFGQFTRETVCTHYAKPDSWLIKYGRKIIAERNLVLSENVSDEEALAEGKKIPEAIANYMCSGNMMAIIFSSTAENTFDIAREILGHTEPVQADSNSIRGKYSKDSFHAAWTEESSPRAIQNICHCSDSLEEAEREVTLYLGQEIADEYFK